MSRIKKMAHIGKNCVACGVCKKTCPLSAISIHKGMFAVVDGQKCIGCGKCASVCSAGVIKTISKENVQKENAA